MHLANYQEPLMSLLKMLTHASLETVWQLLKYTKLSSEEVKAVLMEYSESNYLDLDNEDYHSLNQIGHVVGYVQKLIIPIGLGGFVACRALSQRNDDPQTATRPWNQATRDGFVMSEGVGVL
ncbi:3-oxoacyl-[acyl-carrier-protein] synthase I, chloroplastic-like protein, partial [Tanacetum coccineum]